MLVLGALSLDLNWLIGLLGLTEKPISDQSSTKSWPLFILLAIVIGLGWHLLHHLEENREQNPNGSEFEVEDEEHPLGEFDQYFDGDQQLHHRTASSSSAATTRHGACAFCGILSTTRCSRCKTAKYCSMNCQIRHWRSGHKYECFETETVAGDHGNSKHVKKSETESTSNGSQGDGVKWRSDVSRDSDFNNLHGGCEECGSPSTIRCSRCKAVRYCSAKCLIMNWRWHKVHCIAGDVKSDIGTERPNRDVGLLKDSHEEDNINSSGLLSLEFKPEGTSNNKSLIKVPQEPTEEPQIHRTEYVRNLEEEVAKSRNETLLLLSECDEWKKKANFARERYQRLKKETEHQLLVLKNEKESISNAEKKACNVIRSLHERLKHLQIALQESIAEKRRVGEIMQMVESECAKLKKGLQEEHKHAQYLRVESNKSHETAQIAIKEVEAVRKELQEEREHVQRLTKNFLRDVSFAESKAVFAEAKLSDLHKKIKLAEHKICSICLSNEMDLAFGCGHMTCRDCGSKLSKCPICREQITNHIRLFAG